MVKKISAAVLATGLLASTSIQVLANEPEKMDSSNFETVNLQDALNNVKNELTSIEDLQLIVTNIPAGLFTNNIFALSTNIEKINNPQAKLALQKNLEKAIGIYEEKTAEEATEEDSVTETPVVVVPETTEEETEVEKSAPKIEETESNETKKAEKQVAKDLKKAERDAEKAAKFLEKQESKVTQQSKQEERKEKNANKKEEKDKK